MKATKKICFALLLGIATLSQIHGKNLDTLALEAKTDKSSNWHNYARIYDNLFAHLRNKQIKFLEIGFYLGASARMWDNYFAPASKLLFIDIEHSYYQYMQGLSKRCELHIVDQANANALNQFVATVGGDFDVIIDDGGHTMDQQITSFKVLFPHLKSKGIYVIEDLHSSYIQRFRSVGIHENPQVNPNSTITFLQELIHDLNMVSAKTEIADINKCPPSVLVSLNYYQKNIAAIHFYPSLCFIFKR